MDRRTFIGSVAGGLLAVPLAAGAQKPAMPVIGFLCSASPAQWASYVAAFRKGLHETGYVEGQNLAIEFHWAEGQYDRLPQLAADLVRRQVAILVATGVPILRWRPRRQPRLFHRLYAGGRPRRAWLRLQPRTSWWQCNGC